MSPKDRSTQAEIVYQMVLASTVRIYARTTKPFSVQLVDFWNRVGDDWPSCHAVSNCWVPAMASVHGAPMCAHHALDAGFEPPAFGNVS